MPVESGGGTDFYATGHSVKGAASEIEIEVEIRVVHRRELANGDEVVAGSHFVKFAQGKRNEVEAPGDFQGPAPT